MGTYIRDVNYVEVNTMEVCDMQGHNNCWSGGKDQLFFKIYHQNICSLKKNLDEIKIMTKQMICEYDCMVFTEPFRILDASIFKLPMYELIYSGGDLNKNDGVVVYIKNNLNYTYKIIQIGFCKAVQLTVILQNRKKL
nr:unnamed protein product [Callosobruchus analis]